jgi:DNA replication protein DnaC
MFNTDDLGKAAQIRLRHLNVPRQFRGWEWSDLDPYRGAVVETAQKWVERVVAGEIIDGSTKYCGKGLLLTGDPGMGKTALAAVAMQALVRESTVTTWGEGWDHPQRQPARPAYMTYYRQFPQMLQRQMNNDLDEAEAQLVKDIQCLGKSDAAIRVLCLDDVGKEHRTASGWATGLFEGLIRDRFYAGYPTVITSNVALKDWANVYGESAASFAHEAFVSLEILAPEGDRRL